MSEGGRIGGGARPLAEPRLDKQVFKLFHSFIEPNLIGY